jgi:hypothetical protein
MRSAIVDLQDEHGEPAGPAQASVPDGCSFCTRSGPEVRLVRGAAVAICDSCIEIASQLLRPNVGDK